MSTRYYLAIMLLTFLIGCSNQLKLEGKWSYKNSQDEHAEMWFDGKKALLLDETAYAIEIFDYLVFGDSLFFTWQNDTIYRLGYSLESELSLSNESVIYRLKKFDQVVPNIQDEEDFKNSIYPEFSERAKNN